MATTILQWNIRSINSNKSDLLYLCSKHSPSIIALSETWLRPDSTFRLAGYTCLRHDSLDGYGGCGIFIKTGLEFTRFSFTPPPSIFITAARVMDISVISAYIPHPSPRIISSFWSLLSNIPPPLLILGDFNSHSPLWGSVNYDPSGRKMVDFLDSLDLCILNDGRPTRRASPLLNPSAVDLSVCSLPCLCLLFGYFILCFR